LFEIYRIVAEALIKIAKSKGVKSVYFQLVEELNENDPEEMSNLKARS
jgi:hypothetical protein